MKLNPVLTSFALIVAIGFTHHSARAADTPIQKELREFLEKTYATAEKASSIADLMPLLLLPTDFPADYPEVGANFVAEEFGKQFLGWATELQEKKETHTYKVDTLRTVEAHDLVIHVAVILETEKASKTTTRTEIYWLKSPKNSWKFAGREAVK